MTATTDRPDRSVVLAGAQAPIAAMGRTKAAAGLRGSARVAGWVLLAGVPLTMFLLFFFYPVGSLIARGLIPAGTVDLQGLIDVLGKPRVQRIALFTVWQAAASAACAVALGLPGAYVLYRCWFPGRTALRALVTVPFVLPTIVVALAFRTLFAADGPLGSWGLDGSVIVILAAHVFLNYAVVVRTVGSSWAHLDNRPAEAARSLGAGPIRVLLTITLRSLLPAIVAAFVMVFLFCATSFGIMLILGGAQHGTLETEIYRQTAQIGDLRAAAVLSVLQLLLVVAVLSVAAVVRRRGEATLRLRAAVDLARLVRRSDLPAVIVTAVVALLMMLPLAVLVIRSLRTPAGWGVGNYLALTGVGEHNVLITPVTTALGLSLRTGLVAAALSVLLGVALSVVLARRPRRRLAGRAIGALDGLVLLPLGVSAVTVGFGFLIALDAPPLDLRSSPLLIPIAQAMVTTPLVVRMVLPVLRAADDRLRQAAAVLGGGPIRVWWSVDLPIMSRALAGASAFAFAVAIGEFGATSFVARPDTPTLPVVIGRLIARPGAVNAGMALAAAVILAVLCALSVFLVDAAFGGRRGEPGIGGF
jgi:thiamine transport system permease protein